MEPINISYRITSAKSGQTEVFDFELDGESFALAPADSTGAPAWTELGYRQCSHCPLKTEEHSHCPLALRLHHIVSRFHKTKSIDEVELEVITEERRVLQTVAMQRAISSMLGLVSATCGCPKTAYMRPMARFHLPLASEEETVFRVTGMYLLAQYFLTHNGKKGQFAFDGLVQIYDDLHILNKAIASRLQNATDSDSAKNAITLLDMYSTLVPMLLEDQLVEIRGFFNAYLPADEEVPEPRTAGTGLLEKARAFALDMDVSQLALEPIGDKSDGDTPAWLRGDFDEDKPVVEEQKAEAPAPAAPSRIDEILSKSGLSLSLEPTDDEKPDKPVGGRASFSLPDE